MKSRRKASPSSPEAAAARRAQARLEAADPARWGVEVSSLRLAANRDVQAELGARGAVVRARRQDLWDRLQVRGALSTRALGAVRRLQDDMCDLHRTGLGVRDFAPKVDGHRDVDAIYECQIRAGERVRAALDLAGPASAALLRTLAEAQMAGGVAVDWRAVVLEKTGERLADAQGAVLSAAAENLAAAYDLTDRARRSARVARAD